MKKVLFCLLMSACAITMAASVFSTKFTQDAALNEWWGLQDFFKDKRITFTDGGMIVNACPREGEKTKMCQFNFKDTQRLKDTFTAVFAVEFDKGTPLDSHFGFFANGVQVVFRDTVAAGGNIVPEKQKKDGTFKDGRSREKRVYTIINTPEKLTLSCYGKTIYEAEKKQPGKKQLGFYTYNESVKFLSVDVYDGAGVPEQQKTFQTDFNKYETLLKWNNLEKALNDKRIEFTDYGIVVNSMPNATEKAYMVQFGLKDSKQLSENCTITFVAEYIDGGTADYHYGPIVDGVQIVIRHGVRGSGNIIPESEKFPTSFNGGRQKRNCTYVIVNTPDKLTMSADGKSILEVTKKEKKPPKLEFYLYNVKVAFHSLKIEKGEAAKPSK